MLLILLSLMTSADSFLFGVSFGIKKIKLTFIPLLIISLTGIIILMTSAFAGNLIMNYIPLSDFISGILLIGIGMWLCSDTDNTTKNILEHPEKADINKSRNIEPYEAVVTGIILNIDSAPIVITYVMGANQDRNIMILPVFIIIFQIVFIILGIFMGSHSLKKLPEKLVTTISGFFIVLIGLYKLSLYFY